VSVLATIGGVVSSACDGTNRGIMPGMTPRLLALSLAPLLAAGTAFAQAPGDMMPAPAPPPPPGPGPMPGAPSADPCARPPVMAHRWAIGVSVGGFAVAPDEAPEGSEARFRVGELAVRYRASRRIELELAMGGGRQVLDDDTDGELATGSVTFAVRYRFMPEHRWSWWVMGGLGGSVIERHDSTEAERDGATRPVGMLGIGVERRFRRFALQAELRTMGMGPREDAEDPVPVAGAGGGVTGPQPRLPASAITTQAENLSGGMFTLGASYYF
jgi:hypothetical protein